MTHISAHYNNFQQYWAEHTVDELHRVNTKAQHRHLHLSIGFDSESQQYILSLYEGRNEATCVTSEHLIAQDDLQITAKGFTALDGAIVCEDDTLYLYQWDAIEILTDEPYVMKQCRYFSGWIQYPPEAVLPDELYSQRDLVLHDQGAMVELDVDGVDYTVELTQLVYAHTLYIMKLAIYDLPLSEVGINSKAISYTWTNPEATRIGINLRKVITGWTLMEDDYINSNNLKT